MKTTVTTVDPADLEIVENSDDEITDGADETQERTFGTRVKLTVEVDQETFEEAIEQAFRKIAKEVRVPGFRKGNERPRGLSSTILLL